MIELLDALSKTCNVSGCEDAMRDFLSKLLRDEKIACIETKNDCLTVLNRGTKEKRIAVIVAMDVPGFIALFCENGIAHLVPTDSFSFQNSNGKKLIGENKKTYSLLKSKEDEQDYYLKSARTQCGDVFKIHSELREEDQKICGHFAASYALILLLKELIASLAGDENQKILFVFSASDATKAAKALGVLKDFKPDFSIQLGKLSSDVNTPILLVRDGPVFSDVNLLHSAQGMAKALGISVNEVVSQDPVTKSGIINTETGIPTLSLALPFSRNKNEEECFSISTYKALKILLREILA